MTPPSAPAEQATTFKCWCCLWQGRFGADVDTSKGWTCPICREVYVFPTADSATGKRIAITDRDEDGDVLVQLQGYPHWSLAAHADTLGEALRRLADFVDAAADPVVGETPLFQRVTAKDFDFAVDVTLPRDVQLRRFEELIEQLRIETLQGATHARTDLSRIHIARASDLDAAPCLPTDAARVEHRGVNGAEPRERARDHQQPPITSAGEGVRSDAGGNGQPPIVAGETPAPPAETPSAPDAPHVREDYQEVWKSGWRAGYRAALPVSLPAEATPEDKTTQADLDEVERQHAFGAGYRAAQGYTDVKLTPKCQEAYWKYRHKFGWSGDLQLKVQTTTADPVDGETPNG